MSTDAPVVLRSARSLSAAQQVVWAGQRLLPDVPLSNMATLSRFDGPIDDGRLVAAFDEVAAASDALRTVVDDRGGVAVPSVRPEPPGSTAVVDVADGAIDRFVQDRISRPLPLHECGYDSVLLREPDGSTAWYLCLHHVITDATSSSLVYAATAAAYEGRPFDVGSYREHLEQLDGREGNAAVQKASAYWSAPLPAADPISLYGPAREPSSCTPRTETELSNSRTGRMTELLQGPLATLSFDMGRLAMVATTLAVTLHRLAGVNTVRVGVPVHHRSSEQTRNLVGLLMELYPITIEVGAGDTFRTVYDRAVRDCFAMLRRAEPGTAPRQDFEVVLNVVPAAFGPFGEVGATTQWLHSGHVDPAHRLRCQLYDFTGDGQTIALDVSESLADSAGRDRTLEHVLTVLDAFLADPDAAIGSFSLVSDRERSVVIDDFNEDARSRDLAPVDVVGALRSRSDRAALSDGRITLDGGQLADRIDTLAHWLAGQGIGVGDRVGIELPRSVEAVVAVHGVLRSGAAFCPIDPELPTERRRALLEDLAPALVLEELPDLSATVSFTPDRAPRSDDLAYVLFTSGSTGRPKGVPITHEGLSQYLDFALDAYVDSEPPVVALHSSLSFDLTITSLFLPLLAGGEMVVIEPAGAEGLREIVDARRVTMLKATPSHLELLVRMLGADHPLRTLIVGGEAFGRDLADRLLAARPGLAIYNEYGPTEAVVGCMIHRYDPATDEGPEVPIGRPAPGAAIVTLDPYGHPTPLGASGELYLHRPGMAAGYWQRSELTADRFVSRPEVWPDLLYRTGDRVRMIDSRTMVYEGRLDEQLKLGGIRIEPGEIEAAINTHPAVDHSVVRLWSPSAEAATGPMCQRCGLGADVPGVTIDDGVCSVCREYDAVSAQAEQYFGTPADLRELIGAAGAERSGDYDCLHLLSGGKDSTYALYQLVGMGLRVRALTLDNGFISDGAKANVSRAVEDLGVDHQFVTTDAMNAVFKDSLERYSNVCNGCFKVLYTLAVHTADELDIPVIVTGLSRGQFFETRLTPAQFTREGFDPATIDATVLAARKAYHREHDAVSDLMDTSVFATDEVFDRIRFVDFYRYTDVELDEMYSFLDARAPWVRPADTGRSTNCLVNAAGIHVHRLERGFHNYAMPYSWDVRLGHKTRDEALAELDDPVVADEVASMLHQIGYTPRPTQVLTAWYVADDDIDPADLRARLVHQLPAHALPAAFVRVDHVPLTVNGKVDTDRLEPPGRTHRIGDGTQPETATEELVAEVWGRVLGLESVSVTTPFFDLGGTSLRALEMIVMLADEVGIDVPESLAFQHRTVRDLALQVDGLLRAAAGEGEEAPPSPAVPVMDDERPLSVGEESLLFQYRVDPTDTRYNVTRLYHLEGELEPDRLSEAVAAVVAHQAVLHTAYGADRLRLTVDQALEVTRRVVVDDDELMAWADEFKSRPFDLDHGPLVRLGSARCGGDRWALLIGVPHVVADAGALDVFWDQVAQAYDGQTLPELPVSYAEIGHRQRERHRIDPAAREFWGNELADIDGPTP
ncbi:MAG: amino acid adenylation domain-containing protein, partial [Acidimicrobiales bacterium]